MKRMCLFLVALMVVCAIFTCAAMSMAGPLGLFRNASAQSDSAESGYGHVGMVPTLASPARREVKEEIPRLEDGGKNYLTVLGDVDGNTVQMLQKSIPIAHFTHYKNGDPLAERYRPYVGEFPAVVYQEPSGRVIEKRSGANFPRSMRELTGFADDCRPFRPRPEPTPPVQPAPAVVPLQPLVVPDTVPEEEGADVWVYVLLLALSGAGAAGYQWYKEIKGDE